MWEVIAAIAANAADLVLTGLGLRDKKPDAETAEGPPDSPEGKQPEHIEAAHEGIE